jgi:hypothetical protein
MQAEHIETRRPSGGFSDLDIERQNRDLDEHPDPDFLVDDLEEDWDAGARGYDVTVVTIHVGGSVDMATITSSGRSWAATGYWITEGHLPSAIHPERTVMRWVNLLFNEDDSACLNVIN